MSYPMMIVIAMDIAAIIAAAYAAYAAWRAHRLVSEREEASRIEEAKHQHQPIPKNENRRLLSFQPP